MGDIDITDLVNAIASAAVKVEVDLLFQASTSLWFTAWLKLPVISDIYKTLLTWLFTWISTQEVNLAFYENTAIRKASQGNDFMNAHNFLKALPPNVTEEAYAKAEQAEIAAFNSFVRATT